ncbi:DUF4446 family protein [Paenibacillus sp. y28]|uniref:DUF4446 family protein n=1 Tax=Paenibacillus sp. y28 TaxID=3129110 RepID=UPI00301A3881
MILLSTEQLTYAIIALLVLVVVLFFLLLGVSRKLGRVRSQYLQFINNGTTDNMEQLVIDLQKRVNELQEGQVRQQQTSVQIQADMKKMQSKVGVHRYNAFGERGNDLSFSVAILNEYQDGVVLTGIHNREDTYIYAKPVAKGQSTYTLTPEEKEAIARSGQGSSS